MFVKDSKFSTGSGDWPDDICPGISESKLVSDPPPTSCHHHDIVWKLTILYRAKELAKYLVNRLDEVAPRQSELDHSLNVGIIVDDFISAPLVAQLRNIWDISLAPSSPVKQLLGVDPGAREYDLNFVPVPRRLALLAGFFNHKSYKPDEIWIRNQGRTAGILVIEPKKETFRIDLWTPDSEDGKAAAPSTPWKLSRNTTLPLGLDHLKQLVVSHWSLRSPDHEQCLDEAITGYALNKTLVQTMKAKAKMTIAVGSVKCITEDTGELESVSWEIDQAAVKQALAAAPRLSPEFQNELSGIDMLYIVVGQGPFQKKRFLDDWLKDNIENPEIKGDFQERKRVDVSEALGASVIASAYDNAPKEVSRLQGLEKLVIDNAVAAAIHWTAAHVDNTNATDHTASNRESYQSLHKALSTAHLQVSNCVPREVQDALASVGLNQVEVSEVCMDRPGPPPTGSWWERLQQVLRQAWDWLCTSTESAYSLVSGVLESCLGALKQK